MRKGKLLRYLIAMIMALGTTFNAMAQERALKIYFNEYANGETTPRLYVTDDHPNGEYDVPLGVTVSAEGMAWAKEARFFGGLTQGVNDRLLADYVRDENGNYYTDNKGNIYKKESHLKLKFTNFPYEVNMIQWNKMNDLFSGFSWSDLIMNYNIATNCVPFSGNSSDGFSSSEEHWALNVFTHNASFSKKDIPWQDGKTLNGLTSFEINEGYDAKIGLGRFTFIDLGKKELSNKCRTFIKAGWNGVTGTGSNIHDSDDENWAFKVKFTLPDVRMRCKNIATGNVDNNIIVQEEGVHRLEGYISAHPGAVQGKIDNPQDPDDFHFEYTVADADKSKIEVKKHTGIITKAKAAGTATVRVTLMRGDRVVSYYDQTIRISAVDPNAPEIAIAFANGKKGYDITVGDTNAQIQGVITKNGKDSNGNTITNYSSYHYEYSVDDTNIATIDPSTGVITALKEGDVNVSAVLKDANGRIYSNTYTYNLHVFAMHEGLEFRRINTYHYTTSSNNSSWKIADHTNSTSYDWQSNDLLRVNTSISGNYITDVNNWKQIASFSTGKYNYWRAIAQEIAFDLYVPKYTMASATYSFAGNASIGTTNNGSCRYGFEFYYLNQGKQIDENEAYSRFINRNWNTYETGDISGTILRTGSDSYHSNVGDGDTYVRATDNVTSPKRNENRKLTVYFAAMAYLWDTRTYPGDVSIGFKGVPEYTYYSTVTYHKNDGTGAILGSEEFNTQSKTETKVLYSNLSSTTPTRTGYTFAGWSTDPNSETATVEYTLNGNFRVYDAENGGGMGPVNLYAVWVPNTYVVTLNHNYFVNGSRPTEDINVVYGQPMPDGVNAPVNPGYDFTGYRTDKSYTPVNYYYDADMKSVRNYDKAKNYILYANWVAHTTHITFDFQGGDYGATETTATYGEAMPTSVWAPTKTGYIFGGYYSSANGGGTQYYKADMTSARTWNIDEPEVTLYAKWTPNKYLVTLNKQGGTGGTKSVTGTYGQPLPSGNTAPTKPGYDFKGYYKEQNQEGAECELAEKPNEAQEYGGPQYYDNNMVGVRPWDTDNATIYAHWKPKTYTVTLDAGEGVLPNPVIDDNAGNYNITKLSNSKMELKLIYKLGKTNNLVHSAAKRPGYELLGWFDEQGNKVIEVDEKSRNCFITSTGGYWEENGGLVQWAHIGNITLEARYRQKYQTPYENVIAFDNEKVEDGEDWLWAVVNDLVGAAQEVYQKTGQQTMIFDLRKSSNMWTGHEYDCQKVMDELQKPEYAEFISPNLIVHFNTNSYYDDKCYNAVTADNKCRDLRVTDRTPIKILEAFDASQASYARDAGVVSTPENPDGAFEQAKVSYWGTLCLPYPIRNKANGVRYFWLESTANNYMEFQEFADDAVIPANTPVLYNRTDGAVGSQITIEEYNRNVPKNLTYEAVTIDYADEFDPLEGYYPNEVAHESIHDWQFIGNLKMSIFCGKGYSKDYNGLPAGAQEVTEGNVFYFKQNTFTHLLPSRDIDGKHYKAGRMNLYPYRAYFYKKPKSNDSGSKISTYSIVVVSEEGATDITNLVFGDGEGDGKIYDLTGVRVMQPVKGRIYIVNGQKKMYK